MDISIRFEVSEKYSARAIKQVTSQCEECLSMLTSQGIPIENIRIGNDSVAQEHYDESLTFCAIREIIMRLPFDVGVSNCFMELIREKEYEASLSIKPLMFNKSEIKKELLLMAIELATRAENH